MNSDLAPKSQFGSAEPDERRHEHDVSCVRAAPGYLCRLCCAGQEPDVVDEPRQSGPRGQHDRFDSPGEGPSRCHAMIGKQPLSPLLPNAPKGGGSPPTSTSRNAPVPNVAFGVAGPDTTLPDQRGLLVADYAADERGALQGACFGDRARRGHEGGHAARRDAEPFQPGQVPAPARLSLTTLPRWVAAR